MNYSEIYTKEIMGKSDGWQNLNNQQIKFGDALLAICYIHDIPCEAMYNRFPEVKTNERFAGGGYTINDQIEFIQQNKKRTPKNILEIGSGRGEVVLLLDHMGYNVTAVEPGKDFHELLETTNQRLFGKTTNSITVINSPLGDIDYSQFDSILMIESLEHIKEEDFDWHGINNTFTGYFTCVNWKAYHPIAVGQFAPAHVHCRLVDDALYDAFTENNRMIVRDRSHLCIEVLPK